MPTYEFRCPDGTIIERMFKMSEVPDEIPSPNGDGVATRIISGGAGLLFKGTGFYITDYGKDGKKDQRSATSDSKGGEAKAESKPEAKADAAPKPAESKPAAPSSPAAKSE